MATTTHIGLTLVEQAQAQKEVTVNMALSRIDALLNTGALDKDLDTPPGSPSAGDVYIVGSSPTDEWAGKAEQIAYFDQIWRFVEPNEGMSLWVSDEDLLYIYDGAAWATSGTGETNTASNLGSGEGVYASKSGVDLQFKSLVAGSAVSLNATSNDITIAVGGGKQTVYIPAAAMRPSQTGGCAALGLATTSSNKPDISTLDFDATTEEYAQVSFRMPKSWNEGTISAAFEWSHPTASTNFAVVWGIQGVAVGDGDSIDAAFGTAQEVTDTGGTANTLYKSAETSAITLAGTPQEHDTVYLRVYRKAADGSDTLAVDARLHGIALFFTTNAGNDA